MKEKNTDIKKHVEVSNSLRDNSLITIKIKSDINNLCQKKIKIAIAGATGYVGLDLIKFLSKHPMVKIKYLCAQKKL